MSKALYRAAVYSDIDDSNAKFVLVTIAAILGDEPPEGGCLIEVDLLNTLTGLSPSSIYRALKYLRENNWITTKKRNHCNIYYLNQEKLANPVQVTTPTQTEE